MRTIFLSCIIFTFFIMLSGCAVVSVSQHQTAEMLGEGTVRVTGGVGVGRDLAEGTTYSPEMDEDSEIMYGFPLFEVGLGVGVTEKLDIGGMFWTGLGGAGLRTYAKFAIPSTGAYTSYAFAPVLVYSNTEGERTVFGDTDEFDYLLLGLELPLLISYRATSGVSFYGSGRVHLYNLAIDDPGFTDGRESFFIAMPGVTGGIQLRAAGIDITPEVSAFYIYDRIKESGTVRFFPNFGLSFRF